MRIHLRLILLISLSAVSVESECGRVQIRSSWYNVFHKYERFRGNAIIPKIRIIGGEKASEGAWPWQALIRYRDRETGHTMVCGGTLISSRHVLTAAHCAYTMDAPSSSVLLGTIDSSSQNSAGQSVDILKATVHSKYEPNEEIDPSQTNDIAVLTLASSVSYSNYIQPICLPSPNTSLQMDYAYATGFGAYNKGTNIGSVSSRYLQQVFVPIIPNGRCSEIWETLADYGGGFPISDTQICSGAYGKGTAQGDSGGPLVIQNADGRWFQVGVTSFGVNMGPLYYDQAAAPGVYTRVRDFCSFISEATAAEVECGKDGVVSTSFSFLTFAFLLLLHNIL